ncbi:unnamed protein product, partial [Tenebrio molitor]
STKFIVHEDYNNVTLDNDIALIYLDQEVPLSDNINAKICARGSTTPCHGDSGAPLLCRNEQAGVVSGGAKYCNQSAPSVYTNVFYYTYWIQKEIENYLK